MGPPERNDRGRFTPNHSDEEFLDVVDALEMAGTSDVADELGVTRQNADQRLRRLRDEGRVESRKIGNSLVWSLPEDA